MIGELLTHKDTKVTRRYAKFLPKAKKKAAEEAARLLIKSETGRMENKTVRDFKIKSI